MNTLYWIGTSNSNWNNPFNWSATLNGPSANLIPDSNTNVIFNNNISCNLSSNVSVNSITLLQGNVNFGSYSVQVNDIDCQNGFLDISSATLTVNNFTLSNGIIRGDGGGNGVTTITNLVISSGAFNCPPTLIVTNVDSAGSEHFFTNSATITCSGTWLGNINYGNSTIIFNGNDCTFNGLNIFWNLTIYGKATNPSDHYINVLGDLSVFGELNLVNNLTVNSIASKTGPINCLKLNLLGNKDKTFPATTYECFTEIGNYVGQNAVINFNEGTYNFEQGLHLAAFNPGVVVMNLLNTHINVTHGLSIDQGQTADLTINFDNSDITLNGSANYLRVKKFGNGNIDLSTSVIRINDSSEEIENICQIDSDIKLNEINNFTSMFVKNGFSAYKVYGDGYFFLDNSVNCTINVDELHLTNLIYISDKDIVFNTNNMSYINTNHSDPALTNVTINASESLTFSGLDEFNTLDLIWGDGYNLLINANSGSFEYCNLKNIIASLGQTLNANNCSDLGNNFNINFGLIPSVYLHPIEGLVSHENDLILTVDYTNIPKPNVFICYLNGERISSTSTNIASGTLNFTIKNLNKNQIYECFIKVVAFGSNDILSNSEKFTTTANIQSLSILERIASHENYPKLANQVQAPGAGDITNAVFDNLHYWDLLVLDAEVIQNAPRYLGPNGILRNRNPNIVCVLYFSSFDYNPNVPPLTPQGYDYFPTLRYFVENLDPNYILRDISGNPVLIFKGEGWENWTSALNYATNIKTYLPQVMNDRVISSGLTDGIFFDWASTEIHWFSYANNGSGPIDMNNDGIAEPDEVVNQNHVNGWKEMISNCRSLFPEETIIIGNAGWWTGPEYTNSLNGVMIENFQMSPNTVPDHNSWAAQMSVYAKYDNYSVNPKLSFIMSNSLRDDDYAFARYTLSSALMFNGYFCHTNSNAGYQSARWQDEYAVNRNTREASRDFKYKGWLGKPLGHAFNFNDPSQLLFTSLFNGLTANNNVWMREFEYGIAIVNPTEDAQSIHLDKTYYKIKGFMDTSFNDGSEVNDIILNPRSGVVLIK